MACLTWDFVLVKTDSGKIKTLITYNYLIFKEKVQKGINRGITCYNNLRNVIK